MIKIEISGSSVLNRSEIVKAVGAALKAARLHTAKVSVAFVSREVMRRWNKLYRKSNMATDVLSFGFSRPSGEEKRWQRFGELLIAESVAKKNAQRKKLPPKDELKLLLIHGVLHLSGYNHEKKSEEKKMFALQERILKSLK